MKTTARLLIGIAIAPLAAVLGLAALLTFATMLALDFILPGGSLQGPEVEHDPY